MQTLILAVGITLIVLLVLLIVALFSFQASIHHLAANVNNLECANFEVFKHMGVLDEKGRLISSKKSK